MTGRGGTRETLPRLADLKHLAAPLEPDADQRRRLTELAVSHVETFLAAAPSAPTLRPSHGVAEALAAYGVPDTPRDPTEVLEIVQRLVETPGVATTSPRYLGYIPSGGLFSAAVADFLAAASNRYAGQAAISPGAAGLEHVIIRWIAEAVGLGAHAGGVLTSGGTMGALTAIVTARDAGGVLEPGSPPPVVYLTEQTHHSVDVALRMAGLAGAIVRRLPVDGRHRMDVDELERLIRTDRAGGRHPFLVVATAGTTNTGTVDPLNRIADIAQREDLWLHVDGAYGGLFALSPEGREVLAGIERADSLVVDPHKTLFLPYGTGAVLVRRRSLLESVFAASAAYLAPHPTGEPPSPADLGPELTRHFRALRVWLPLQLAGRLAFSAALSEKILLARHAHERLASVPGIEVGPKPDLSIVTFRCATASPEDDGPTAQLAANLQRSGEVFLTTTRLNGRLVLRVAVGSFRTHLDDVDAVVDAVARAVSAAPRAPTRLADAANHRGVLPQSTQPVGQRRPGLPEALRLEFLTGPPDDAVLRCEADVLGRWYKNTAEELERAYDPYAGVTVWLVVRDDLGGVHGWCRIITPGVLPLKTIADVSQPPWNVAGEGAAFEAGLDLTRTWDVTTIGVRPELGATAGSRVTAALYHGLKLATEANGVRWLVAVLDVRVRHLLKQAGLAWRTIPGTDPRPYMGSPSSVPVYGDIHELLREQRLTHPGDYYRVMLGGGLRGIVIPPHHSFWLPTPAVVDLEAAAAVVGDRSLPA